MVVFCTMLMLQPSKAANGIVLNNDGTEQLLAYAADNDGWEYLEHFVYAYVSNGEFIESIQVARKYANGQWYYKVRPHGVGPWYYAQRGNYTCGNRKLSYTYSTGSGGARYFNI